MLPDTFNTDTDKGSSMAKTRKGAEQLQCQWLNPAIAQIFS